MNMELIMWILKLMNAVHCTAKVLRTGGIAGCINWLDTNGTARLVDCFNRLSV